MKYTVFKDFEISCAHQLWKDNLTTEENKALFGKCANTPCHGHNYIIRIYVSSNKLINGMVINFTDLKKVFLEKIDKIYDHQNINFIEPFKSKKILTTAENFSKVIFDIMVKEIKDIEKVEIWETSRSCASYGK